MKYRTVIHLFYYEDMATADISKVLDLNESTVRSKIYRGRNICMQASIISMVIYDGRVYVQSGTKVSIEDGKLLMDEKIGVTKDLSDFMEKSDTEVGGRIDFNKVEGLVGVGGEEIYSAKGYDENINNFAQAMNESIPYSLEDKEFRNQFYYNEIEYYEEGQDKQKFLYLDLKDGTTIQIRLFSNGYITYNGLYGVIFKVEDKAFKDLWNMLITPGV